MFQGLANRSGPPIALTWAVNPFAAVALAQCGTLETALLGETQLVELLEAAPDAILLVDADGCIEMVNRATEDLFGYSRQELLGQLVDVLVPEQLRAGHGAHREGYGRRPARRAMGTGMELLGRRKDGSEFPVEISLSPNSSGDGLRVTAIVRDVTERKHAEERLLAVREEYTEKLAAQNRELEIRNREIERANRLKSEFLASMSHELRSPLHTIIGFSELLGEELEGPLNDKQKRFVEHIHRDSLHLLRLIDDILDLSKIEAGRLELRREVFDVQQVVDESLGSMRVLAEAKSIQLEQSVEVPEAVEADRVRIKQVLVNLLSNAVKFTPEGGRVNVAANSADGMLTIAVRDTGIGIEAEQLDAIFDKFYQLSATTKGVREGTGLGLAITRLLVEGHGGEIRAASIAGEGSCFTFTIPMRQTGEPV